MTAALILALILALACFALAAATGLSLLLPRLSPAGRAARLQAALSLIALGVACVAVWRQTPPLLAVSMAMLLIGALAALSLTLRAGDD